MTVAVIDPRQEWATPDEFFALVDSEFAFNIDVCATEGNAKCPVFISPEQDGLLTRWDVGLRVSMSTAYEAMDRYKSAWCNPGFGNVLPWLQRALQHAQQGMTCCVLTHADSSVEWYESAYLWADECRQLIPRIQFVPSPGIKASSKSKGNLLWIFRPYKPASKPCHVWLWRWKEEWK